MRLADHVNTRSIAVFMVALIGLWLSTDVLFFKRRQPCADGRWTMSERVQRAEVIVTGTVVRIVADPMALTRVASVRVKRVIKGESTMALLSTFAGQHHFAQHLRSLEVHSIDSPAICDSFVRRRDSMVFLLRRDTHGQWALNSSLIVITLRTLNEINSLTYS